MVVRAFAGHIACGTLANDVEVPSRDRLPHRPFVRVRGTSASSWRGRSLHFAEKHAKSSPAVEVRERAGLELCSQSSIALETVSDRPKHLAVPSASLAVPGATRAKDEVDPREMSLLTPRGTMIDSKEGSQLFYEGGELVDRSGHGTLANADLYEIIQDLVEALSPLQTVSKEHEERMATLEQERESGRTHALFKSRRYAYSRMQGVRWHHR